MNQLRVWTESTWSQEKAIVDRRQWHRFLRDA